MNRCQRVGIVLSILLILASSGASSAAAQSIFIDGAAFASIERRDSYTSEPYPIYAAAPDLDGTVAGGSAAIGLWLTPSVSVRFEVGWPAQLETTVEQRYPIPAVSGVSLPYPGYRSTIEVRDRIRTFSPLLAWHTARRHGVQLGFIGGATFVARTQQVIDDTIYPLYLMSLPSGLPGALLGGLPTASLVAPQRTETTTTTYGVTAQAGLDADIALGAHVSMVPQIRAIGFGGGLSVRPGVGIRIRF